MVLGVVIFVTFLLLVIGILLYFKYFKGSPGCSSYKDQSKCTPTTCTWNGTSCVDNPPAGPGGCPPTCTSNNDCRVSGSGCSGYCRLDPSTNKLGCFSKLQPSSCETTVCKTDSDCPTPCGIPNKYDRYMCDFKINHCSLASLVDYNNFDAVVSKVTSDTNFTMVYKYYFKDTYVWICLYQYLINSFTGKPSKYYYTLKRVNEVFTKIDITIFPIDAVVYDSTNTWNFFKGDTLYTLKDTGSIPVKKSIISDWIPDTSNVQYQFSPTTTSPIQSATYVGDIYYFVINNALYSKKVGSSSSDLVKYVGNINSSDGWSGLPSSFLSKSSKLIFYWDFSNNYYYFFYGNNYVGFKYGKSSTTPTITPIPKWPANASYT